MLSNLKEGVSKLNGLLKNEISLVNETLLEDLPPDIALLKDVFESVFKSGGKRLRPLLTLAVSRIISDKSNEYAVFLAAAVELIHTATLLHDDVIDNSMMRRNSKTVNNIWDNKTAILVGDNMFSRSFQLIVQSNKMKALKELADASALISAGEVSQLEMLGRNDIAISEYINLITSKTAVLFAAACAVGAIVNDCSCEKTGLFRSFGMNFGMLYQIYDDYLDYFGDPNEMGKDTFQDLKEGKVTLPIILLMEKLEGSELHDEIAFLKNSVASQNIDNQRILNLLKDMNIEDAINEFSAKYREKAVAKLKLLKLEGEIADALAMLIS